MKMTFNNICYNIRGSVCISVFALIAMTLASCSNSNTGSVNSADTTSAAMKYNTKPADIKPLNPMPEWGRNMTNPMAAVIEKLVSFKAPPLTTLSAIEARKQPSPADAAMAVMQDYQINMPPNNIDTTGKEIQVPGGQIHLRIYTPKTGKSTYPVIVYYHGGGWVIADLNTYNASALNLANLLEAVVVSVAYRQAPENKFPVAHNDSYAAYEWTVKNAASIMGDPKKIALVGESAGGNLAAAVSMMARDKGFQMPVHQVLIYPIAGDDFTTPSYKEADSTVPLSSGLMKWFFDKYLNAPADGKSPMISIVNANLKGLPGTTIIAAEYDPLRSEGEMLSNNLSKAGVSTSYKLYKGVTHEFFGMAAVIPEAKQAQGFAADELKKAFN